jgi:hypothetical protein
MTFSITGLLDDRRRETWLLENFRPEGLRYPKRGSPKRRLFRHAHPSKLTVYSSLKRECIYNLYSDTFSWRSNLLLALPRWFCSWEG